MADFDFSTLVTDRSPADLETLRALLAVPLADWTAEQLAEFNLAASKGAYNYTDLNRVTAAMDYLNEVLTELGYQTGYQRVKVPHKDSGGGGRLPEGYTELEYIESTGTQYVDTGILPGVYTLLLDFQFDPSTNGVQYLMGHTANQGWYFGASNNIYDGGLDTAKISLDSTQRRTLKIESLQDSQILTIDGQTVSVDRVLSVESTLSLFKITSANYWVKGKLYGAKITQNGELIRDFVPCINSEGAVGLYDTVGAQFYGNAGTGAFIAGLIVGYDPHTLLLLHGESLEDSSGYRVPVTNTGVVVSDVQSKFGGKSLYFDGNSHFLTIQNLPTDPLVDFTIDFWAYLEHPTVNSQGLFELNSYEGDGGELEVYQSNLFLYSHGSNLLGEVAYPGFEKWTHVAVVRSSGTIKLYLDGVLAGTGDDSGVIQSRPFFIGFYQGGNNYLQGYLDEFRVSDVARWTGNFTPEVEPYNPIVTPEPEQPKDPYLWYEDDVPTHSQLSKYLSNVLAIWDTIMKDPTLPGTMENLTFEEANQIEAALFDVNTAIEQIIVGMARSNSFTFWSGNRPFPTARSNLGRNWGELDAMNTTWRNWQVATWYLLLYGNLAAEGDVT